MESKKLNEKLIAAHLEGDKCKLCPTGKGSIKHKKNLPPHVRAFHPGEYSKNFFRIATDSGSNFISAFKYGSCTA